MLEVPCLKSDCRFTPEFNSLCSKTRVTLVPRSAKGTWKMLPAVSLYVKMKFLLACFLWEILKWWRYFLLSNRKWVGEWVVGQGVGGVGHPGLPEGEQRAKTRIKWLTRGARRRKLISLCHSQRPHRSAALPSGSTGSIKPCHCQKTVSDFKNTTSLATSTFQILHVEEN